MEVSSRTRIRKKLRRTIKISPSKADPSFIPSTTLLKPLFGETDFIVSISNTDLASIILHGWIKLPTKGSIYSPYTENLSNGIMRKDLSALKKGIGKITIFVGETCQIGFSVNTGESRRPLENTKSYLPGWEFKGDMFGKNISSECQSDY